MGECPPTESLARLLRDELGGPDLARVLAHVEACPVCQEALDGLSQAATPHLRPALSEDTDTDPSAEADALFRRLRKEASAGGGPGPGVEGYEILGEIGRGAAGVVYRARHHALGRLVALKMIAAGPHLSPEARERFRREAQAVARLRHPNIIQVYEVGEQAGCPYLALELAEGGTLAGRLAGTPRPADEAARVVATLAGAVGYAHEQGVVHRDLKPANILVDGEGTTAALKVADFGLAKLTPETGAAPDRMTRTGAILGTPIYVAPEQARGDAEVGPAADVYSLGVILYEALTGRPPFQGATAMETLVQAAHQDPVPPTRLVPQVPRDLETICLQCLRKDPRLRYASAADLAEDLGRFLRGEAISARPEGWPGWLARQVRRAPGLWAAGAASTLLALALVAGGLWTLSERRAAEAEGAAAERAAGDDITEMAGALGRSDWARARAALERARGRLGARPAGRLRGLLRQGGLDLDLADRLEAIAINGADGLGGKFLFARSDEEYEAAFRRYGHVHDDAGAVGELVAASDIWPALVEGLDHWASRTQDARRRDWVLSVAREAVRRRAGPDPAGWRNRVRDPAVWADGKAFERLVNEAPLARQPVALLLAMAQRLRDLGKNPIPFLKRAQQAHPADFWANYNLGYALWLGRDPVEAVRYFQAALAVRPVPLVRGVLGVALYEAGRKAEAVEQFRLALEADPRPVTRKHLALALSEAGSAREAIEQCRLAFKHYPKDAALHLAWGVALERERRHEEAMRQFQLAAGIDPNGADIQMGLRNGFLRRGRPFEALAAWGKALAARPSLDHRYHYGYAERCLFMGMEPEYRRARKALLDRFGSTSDPLVAERAGRACLLLPVTGEELDRAVAMIDRALTADRARYKPVFPSFRFAKGLADYRQGRFRQAAAAMRGDASRVMGPAPRLVLAMALHKTGHPAEARRALAEAIPAHDWRGGKVQDQDGCIFHVLRREAERLILPNLPAFLEGKYEPRENDERLGMIGACQLANRALALARLYADAFAADPRLAENWLIGHRATAARYAALAGCGVGVDAGHLKGAERARWRAQARSWLRAELAALGKASDGGPALDRERVRWRLANWRADPDLAGLRDPTGLGKLPADEREDCVALWKEVGVMFDRAGGAR